MPHKTRAKILPPTKSRGISRTMRLDLMGNIAERVPKPQTRLAGAATQREGAEDLSGSVQRREGQAEYHDLLNSLYDAALVCDLDGKIVDANRRALDFLSFTRAELCGMPVGNVIFGLDESILKTLRANLESERFTLIDACCLRKDASYFPSEIAVSKLAGEQTRLCFFVRDTTVRLHLEAELAHARKLESLGMLAAGIAHEINTPIQFISDNCSYIGKKLAQISELMGKHASVLSAVKLGDVATAQSATHDTESFGRKIDVENMEGKILRALQQCRAGLDRVTTMVGALNEFSHPSADKLVESDIAKVIGNVVTVTRNEWAKVAEMEVNIPPDLPPVPCFVDELSQALLNLVMNARDAIAEKIGGSENERGRIVISAAIEGDWASITVADTGTGIAEKIRHMIFDPFFTTKEVGKGSGQGLTIAYNIVVKKHNGRLTFETETGKGTTFAIRLPLRIENETEQAQRGPANETHEQVRTQSAAG